METYPSTDERSQEAALLACAGVHLGYPVHGGWLPVVHGIDLAIQKGETMALVGESGSGKSTLAKALVKLIPVMRGSIRYAGEEVGPLNRRTFAPYRKRIQMIFQDPWQALNPRVRIEDLLAEPLRLHFPKTTGPARKKRIAKLLEAVHLPRESGQRFASEFSGGQRQRVLIARALAVEPELLICDEPLSALDVSTQARLLNLLRELKEDRDLTLLFISHDLAVVQEIADNVAVMQAGRVVEGQRTEELFTRPRHEYTKALLEASPKW